MTDMWSTAIKAYDDAMSKADPRSQGWFLVGSPLPGLLLTVTYVFLVQYALPKYMENRKAYELRRVMMVYNFAMVAISGYICFEFGMGGWFTNYTFGCQLCDYSRSEQAMRMLDACWYFYMTKYIEFIDTFIFCLRKKTNQVSFLHVVHHGIMPMSFYWGVKFGGGGMGTFFALLNSFIHFMMYTYYGLASLGPNFQKYLWWKKYMTKMQMLQFILVAIHCTQLFFTDCPYPRAFNYVIFSYAAFFLCLFAKFYVQSYLKSHSKSENSHTKSHTANGGIRNGTSPHENGKPTNNNLPSSSRNSVKQD